MAEKFEPRNLDMLHGDILRLSHHRTGNVRQQTKAFRDYFPKLFTGKTGLSPA